jgi:hypothetical protein
MVSCMELSLKISRLPVKRDSKVNGLASNYKKNTPAVANEFALPGQFSPITIHEIDYDF